MTVSGVRTGAWPSRAAIVVAPSPPGRARSGHVSDELTLGPASDQQRKRRRIGRATIDAAIVDILRASGPEMIDLISIEMVAERVGISRATAYRHLSDRNTLLARALLVVARGHVLAAITAISPASTACAKIEESFAYGTREALADEILMRLRALPIAANVQPSLRAMARQVLRQVISDGQRAGELRQDVALDAIVDWLLEQQYLMLRLRLTEAQARQSVNTFVLPALRSM
jgi:AcrR family transcriptional regulator